MRHPPARPSRRSGPRSARRLLAIALLVLALLPTTCLHAPPERLVDDQRIAFTDLAPPRLLLGEAVLDGAWRMTSRHSDFGGFSALLALPGARLLAASDGGTAAWFPEPGNVGPTAIGAVGGRRVSDKIKADIESLARDPASGRIWAGYEARNALARYDAMLATPRWVRPRQMNAWSSNSGPEAMARLADGRFIVLSEGGLWSDTPSAGLLFPGDPVAGGKAVAFRLAHPPGYRSSDMASLPDGRALILLRHVGLGLPPRYTAALMLADPARIRPGGQWHGRIIARLAPPVPVDNFEGLAIRPRADGALSLWLVSDDNQAFYQRTLLLRLRWMPDKQKGAPAKPARPS